MMQPLETFERQPTLLLSRSSTDESLWDFGATDVYAAVTLASIMAEVIVSGVNNTREVTRSIPVTFRNLCTGQTLGLMQLTLS